MTASPALERVRWAGVLLATVLGMALTAWLGRWQLDRAAYKEAVQQAIDSRSKLPPIHGNQLARTAEAAVEQHHRPVELRGSWRADATVYLENRQMNARPGFFVVTPLLLPGQDVAVLVQRGWVPRHPTDRVRLPPIQTDEGTVAIVGRIAPPPARLYDLGVAGSGPIRQNLGLAEFGAETGLRLLPLSVVQLDDAASSDDGLMRDWGQPAAGVHKHYGYAFQWFALCALMAGLYVWFQLIRPALHWRSGRR